MWTEIQDSQSETNIKARNFLYCSIVKCSFFKYLEIKWIDTILFQFTPMKYQTIRWISSEDEIEREDSMIGTVWRTFLFFLFLAFCDKRSSFTDKEKKLARRTKRHVSFSAVNKTGNKNVRIRGGARNIGKKWNGTDFICQFYFYSARNTVAARF